MDKPKADKLSHITEEEKQKYLKSYVNLFRGKQDKINTTLSRQDFILVDVLSEPAQIIVKRPTANPIADLIVLHNVIHNLYGYLHASGYVVPDGLMEEYHKYMKLLDLVHGEIKKPEPEEKIES